MEQKVDDILLRLKHIEDKLDAQIRENEIIKSKLSKHDLSLGIIGTIAGSSFTAVLAFILPKMFGG